MVRRMTEKNYPEYVVWNNGSFSQLMKLHRDNFYTYYDSFATGEFRDMNTLADKLNKIEENK